MSDIQQALAVMDERWGGYGNAKAEIRAHIEAQAAEIARLRGELGECFRLAGGDTDGNPGPHHAHRAVEVVRDLRECYEERGDDLEKAEANARRYLWVCANATVSTDRWHYWHDEPECTPLDKRVDDAMRGGAE